MDKLNIKYVLQYMLTDVRSLQADTAAPSFSLSYITSSYPPPPVIRVAPSPASWVLTPAQLH